MRERKSADREEIWTRPPFSSRNARVFASSRSTVRRGSTRSRRICIVALKAALDDIEADSSCRALLITGAGRGFCAGQDLNDRLAKPGEKIVLGGTLEHYYNPLVRRLRALPFPVVAAVNGVAAGAGANIALACDIVLAAKSATFVQAFAKIGLVPDSGGTWISAAACRAGARARRLSLLAEPLSAEKAESWGLIWKAVGDNELMGEAIKLCVQFASGPTYGSSLIKRALDASETERSFDAARSRARFPARGRQRPPTMPKACAPSWKSARRNSPARKD